MANWSAEAKTPLGSILMDSKAQFKVHRVNFVGLYSLLCRN